jgi:Family of unknown function (DUF6879)
VLSPEDFDACFDRFQVDAFRLETFQRYTIPEEEERIRAWKQGLPRPDRSVRTSPWLQRIAVTTAAGKRWLRIHLVDHPLTDYLQYQILGYVESAAAGEEIRIADRTSHPELQSLVRDFWLFDAETESPYAVAMHYDSEGHWLGAEYVDDPQTLRVCRVQRDLALQHSIPLNHYLAETTKVRHVA